jgi:hypothetical protein
MASTKPYIIDNLFRGPVWLFLPKSLTRGPRFWQTSYFRLPLSQPPLLLLLLKCIFQL